MILTIPFYSGDQPQSDNLLDWIIELGGCKNHHLLLVADVNVSVETVRSMKAKALPWFFGANFMRVTVDKQGWPNGCNRIFLKTAEYIHTNCKLPFLWLESDAIPLKKQWLDTIAAEYAKSPMRYMGSVMQNFYSGKEDDKPQVGTMHLNGVAVYPPDAWLFYAPYVQTILSSDHPWDVYDPMKIVSQSRNTALIQNEWGLMGRPPIVVLEKKEGDPDEYFPMDKISKQAVIFHRDKPQHLIALLRGKKK